MNYTNLLQQVEAHVAALFTEQFNAALVYHNLPAARELVTAASQIAGHYHVDERSRFIICTAAWFFNTGYLGGSAATPEAASIAFAAGFLKQQGLHTDDVNDVTQLITAGSSLQAPASLQEKIFCDACTFHFGTPAFKDKMKLLRREKEALTHNKISGDAWRGEVIQVLEKHVYHTGYCATLLNTGKAENLLQLMQRQHQKPVAGGGYPAVETKPQLGAAIKSESPAAARKVRPEKGIETMFRIAATNNVRVSAMADNKASIMITVNAIIISVILGLMAKTLQEYRSFLVPTVVLLFVSVLTMVYAVLATMPRIAKGIFTQEQVEKKSVNLLFFGSYYNMEFHEYQKALKVVMDDSEFLYASLTKDIFWQGKVLGRKYRLLHTAYTIFMWGIIISVLAFAVAMFVS